jgi:ABC-type Na+ efflux pump permease subunit
MDQKTMLFMTAQAILLLGLLAVAVAAADSVAGERERGTLETLLAASLSPGQRPGGYVLGAIAPWVAMVVIALSYLAVVSAGTRRFALGGAVRGRGEWGHVEGVTAAKPTPQAAPQESTALLRGHPK